jgi:Acyltransferase
MSVVFDRMYEFVPPHRGNWWPNFIQAFRLYDYYLRKKEGVVDFELHGLDHFQRVLQSGDGILVTPNHCRYADPLVLGWPTRKLKTHVYAMASWHLFNQSALDSFALRKMGAFSLYREGADRKSLDTAIQVLADAERPLVIFPEGATFRTNDFLKPLLDGVPFIARAAARRAAKEERGVVILPTALKYLCLDDIRPWAHQQLAVLENRLGWSVSAEQNLVTRCTKVAAGLLSLKEVEYEAPLPSGTLPQRRNALIRHILSHCESHLGLTEKNQSLASVDSPYSSFESMLQQTSLRVRSIRSEISSRFFSPQRETSAEELRRLARMVDTVLELTAYNDSYLTPGQSTDSRIVETIQRMQEFLLGKADASVRLKVRIEFDEPIVVPAEKSPRGEVDPLLVELRERLESMLQRLSTLARPMQ